MSLTQFGEKLELRSEVEICAEPSRVWLELTNFSAWNAWNPFIVGAVGAPACGERVVLTVSPPGGRELRVKRKITVLRAPEELRWTGPYGWGLLLRSEQYFLLKPSESRPCTRLTVGENLFGPGVTGNNQLVMNIARGLSLMNQSLKRRVEAL